MTIKINLLPWRQMQRKKERQQFIKLTRAGLILVVLACILVNFSVSRIIERQQNYNRGLQKDLAILNTRINEINKIKKQKKRLIKRIFFLQKLQNGRILVVHLFDELVKLIPEGVYLNLVRGTEKKITLEGFSESNFALSRLMQNIERNPWMQSPNLVEMKKAKPLAVANRFTLSFILIPKKTEYLS
jgi:type IV pilus assembly protein PilN